MSIYIAWGDETLGPYTTSQVAELIECGCLFPDDYGARDGDSAWMPLSSFLTAEAASISVPVVLAAPATSQDAPVTRTTTRLWRPRHLTILLALATVIVGLSLAIMWIKGNRSGQVIRNSRQIEHIVAPNTKVQPVTSTVSPPPAVERGGRLSGTVLLSASDASPIPLDALKIRAYSVKALEPYLAQKKAAARVELAKLGPLIEAADAEKNVRVAAEQSARQVFLNTDPFNELYASVRFAHQQAKTAVKTATDDCEYYRGLRNEVMGGEFYFHDLPVPLVTVETNDQGGFTLELPPGGPFAIAASAGRERAAGTHSHYWMVKISFAEAGQKTLALSESNTTSVACAESLIQTED